MASEESYKSQYNWQEIVENAAEIGFLVDFPVKLSTVGNLHVNSSQIILLILPLELALSNEILLFNSDNVTLEAYHQHQVDMAVRFGAKRDAAENEMLEVLEFEIALANVGDAYGCLVY